MPRQKKVKLIGLGLPANLLKEFIQLSYKGNTSIAPAGYEIDTPLSDSRVKVYTKPNSKEVIVTHRGSVGLQDWQDNISYIVRGKVKSTKTYKMHRDRHLKAVEKYGAENIIGIGHSRAGLYLQELQKEVPIKEIITYNKAVGFYDALQTNPAEQTDVKVKNDFVSLLSGLQKRPKKMVEIEATQNPLDFNRAHQAEEIEKLGETFIGLENKPMEGSGRAPSPKTLEQLKKMLKTFEGKLEKINKGKVYKTTNKEKVEYTISYTKARIKNHETKGEDLIITKKAKYGNELPAKAKAYKAKAVKPKKEEPKKEEPKKEEPKAVKPQEVKPEPKKEEPKKSNERAIQLDYIFQSIKEKLLEIEKSRLYINTSIKLIKPCKKVNVSRYIEDKGKTKEARKKLGCIGERLHEQYLEDNVNDRFLVEIKNLKELLSDIPVPKNKYNKGFYLSFLKEKYPNENIEKLVKNYIIPKLTNDEKNELKIYLEKDKLKLPEISSLIDEAELFKQTIRKIANEREEPKAPEPKPEPPKAPEPKKEEINPKLAKIEEFINDTENYLNKKSTRSFNAFMKKYNDKNIIKSIIGAQKFSDFYPTSQKCLSNYSIYLKNIDEDDIILEPTAGLGSIVLWLLKNNVKSKIIATDFDPNINSYLKESFAGINQVTVLDHAKSDYLDMSNDYYKYNPSVIFLNPPFSNKSDKKYYLNFLFKALYDLNESKNPIRERQLFFISPSLTTKNEKNGELFNFENIIISANKKKEIINMLNINEDEFEDLIPDQVIKVANCNDFGGTNTVSVLYHIITFGNPSQKPEKEEPKKEEPKPKPPKIKRQKAFLLEYKEVKEEVKPVKPVKPLTKKARLENFTKIFMTADEETINKIFKIMINKHVDGLEDAKYRKKILNSLIKVDAGYPSTFKFTIEDFLALYYGEIDNSKEKEEPEKEDPRKEEPKKTPRELLKKFEDIIMNKGAQRIIETLRTMGINASLPDDEARKYWVETLKKFSASKAKNKIPFTIEDFLTLYSNNKNNCSDLMCKYNINSKTDYKKWIIKNHPDKGGTIDDADFKQILICAKKEEYCGTEGEIDNSKEKEEPEKEDPKRGDAPFKGASKKHRNFELEFMFKNVKENLERINAFKEKMKTKDFLNYIPKNRTGYMTEAFNIIDVLGEFDLHPFLKTLGKGDDWRKTQEINRRKKYYRDRFNKFIEMNYPSEKRMSLSFIPLYDNELAELKTYLKKHDLKLPNLIDLLSEVEKYEADADAKVKAKIEGGIFGFSAEEKDARKKEKAEKKAKFDAQKKAQNEKMKEFKDALSALKKKKQAKTEAEAEPEADAETEPIEGGIFGWSDKEKAEKAERKMLREEYYKTHNRQQNANYTFDKKARTNWKKEFYAKNTFKKADDTSPKAEEDAEQQGITETEPYMEGSGYRKSYIEEIAYPTNPMFAFKSTLGVPMFIDPENEYLIIDENFYGGSAADMLGMNCYDGKCFNPVWEKEKIKRQILSEYKIWYWPWGTPPAGHIRMPWLNAMVEDRYKPLYDEFVARRNVNIGLDANASKDDFGRQMFSNLTDALSYVPVLNLPTTIGLSVASAVADIKKEPVEIDTE